MKFGGYKASKLKPQLKMAVTRFQMSANKKSAITKQQIREIAMLLADNPPKEEKARIKAEALIRDDNTVEVSMEMEYLIHSNAISYSFSFWSHFYCEVLRDIAI